MKYLAITAGGSPQKAQLKFGGKFQCQFIPLFDTHYECAYWWKEYVAAGYGIEPWAITTLGNLLNNKQSVADELTECEELTSTKT